MHLGYQNRRGHRALKSPRLKRQNGFKLTRGEIRGVGSLILIMNVPITTLAGNGADGPKRMRGSVGFFEFRPCMKD